MMEELELDNAEKFKFLCKSIAIGFSGTWELPNKLIKNLQSKVKGENLFEENIKIIDTEISTCTEREE